MAYARDGWCASVARRSESALVLVDVINDLEFPGGDDLLAHAHPMAHRLAALKKRTRQMSIPAVYLNESNERWKPSFSRQLDHCIRSNVRGRPIAEILRPGPDDLFLLRSQQASCLAGQLDVLFSSLGVNTLVLTGLAASICGILAANDAYLGGFRFIVPADCVAAKTDEHRRSALRQLRQRIEADTTPSTELFFSP